MAGKMRYFVDAFSDDGANAPSVRNGFAVITKFFEDHPNFERVAADFDGGPGFGPTNGGVEANENSFGIWRAVSASIPFDVAVKWSYSQFYDDNWDTPSNFGLAIGMAYHSSSQAWNGTTNNDGTDSFGTDPWKSGSIAFPRTNGPGGSNHTNRNALCQIASSIASPVRFHIVGDDDAVYFLMQASTDQNHEVDVLCGFGCFTPTTSSFDLPLFMIRTNRMSVDFEYGNISQAEADDGGLCLTQSADLRTFRLDFDQYVQSGDGIHGDQNAIIASSPVLLYQWETDHYNFAGELPILRLTKDDGNYHTTIGGANYHIFRLANDERAIVIPWNGGPPSGFSGSFGTRFLE